MLEISLLGGLNIRLDGESVKGFGSRKAEALFVYLLSNPQPQARETLADLLWDEQTRERGLSSLRTLITRLPTALLPYLNITRQTLAFDIKQPYWFDVARFEGYLPTAIEKRQDVGPTLAAAAVARLEKAVALYRGDYLSGFALRDAPGFEMWLEAEQQRLNRLLIQGLEQLINYRRQRQQYTKGIEQAVRLLQVEPMQEETHRQMLLMLALSGQRGAALRHYKTYQGYLAAELDIAPELATTQLYERIRTNNLPSTDLIEFNDATTNVPTVVIGSNQAQTTRSNQLDMRFMQLKRVSLFAETPNEILAEAAKVLEEVEFEAGEMIFNKGESGHCMYIIIEGRVRIQDGNRIIDDSGEGEVFGEMAVLDAAPRLASVKALVRTRLLKLEQAALYDLMAERVEVARGIIRVLSGRLRDRLHDLGELQQQMQNLVVENKMESPKPKEN